MDAATVLERLSVVADTWEREEDERLGVGEPVGVGLPARGLVEEPALADLFHVKRGCARTLSHLAASKHVGSARETAMEGLMYPTPGKHLLGVGSRRQYTLLRGGSYRASSS
jgi:hypothetical protein